MTLDNEVWDTLVVKLVEALVSGVEENVIVHVAVMTGVIVRARVAVGDVVFDTL